jgi:hypothetical protein
MGAREVGCQLVYSTLQRPIAAVIDQSVPIPAYLMASAAWRGADRSCMSLGGT